MEDNFQWRMTCDGGRPSMEDNLRWKKTFDGRQLLMEDDLWWKTTYDGRRHMMEDDLWWKTTFDGRRHLMEDDLWWKTTFDKDNLRWKTTFDRVTLYYLNKKHLWLLILTDKVQLTLNRKSNQLSKPEIEFHVMEEMYAASCMCACAKKTTFVGKDD